MSLVIRRPLGDETAKPPVELGKIAKIAGIVWIAMWLLDRPEIRPRLRLRSSSRSRRW